MEEALCPQCKSSMEESIVVQSNIHMQKDMLNQANQQKIVDLEQKTKYLEKQIV